MSTYISWFPLRILDRWWETGGRCSSHSLFPVEKHSSNSILNPVKRTRQSTFRKKSIPLARVPTNWGLASLCIRPGLGDSRRTICFVWGFCYKGSLTPGLHTFTGLTQVFLKKERLRWFSSRIPCGRNGYKTDRSPNCSKPPSCAQETGWNIGISG